MLCCGPPALSATVTTTEYVPGGVPVCWFPLLPLPHPEMHKAANNDSTAMALMRLAHLRSRLGENAIPRSPARVSAPVGSQGLGRLWNCVFALEDGPVVAMVRVLMTAVALVGVRDVGLKVQVAWLGIVPHARLTVPVYPPAGVRVKVKMVDWPAVIVAEVGLEAIEKSGAATVIDTELETLAALLLSPA